MVLWTAILAHASPDAAIALTAGAGSADRSVEIGGRVRLGRDWQLGARVRQAWVRAGFVDGRAVEGTRQLASLGAGVPLVRGASASVTLELDVGASSLQPEPDPASLGRNLSLIADLSPMVTLPLGQRAALRLGWAHLLREQVHPSVALDTQGALLRGLAVFAPGPDLQLVLGGATGGLYGFGGDGGKYLAEGHAALRWVPARARTWTNF